MGGFSTKYTQSENGINPPTAMRAINPNPIVTQSMSKGFSVCVSWFAGLSVLDGG